MGAKALNEQPLSARMSDKVSIVMNILKNFYIQDLTKLLLRLALATYVRAIF